MRGPIVLSNKFQWCECSLDHINLNNIIIYVLHDRRDFTNAAHLDPIKRRGLADRIRDASINVGFFYSQHLASTCNYLNTERHWRPFASVKNHGIPENVISSGLDAAKQFFALPEHLKQEVRAVPRRYHLSLIKCNWSTARHPQKHKFQGLYSPTRWKYRYIYYHTHDWLQAVIKNCSNTLQIQRIEEISMRALTWAGNQRCLLHPTPVCATTELWRAKMSGLKDCLVSDRPSWHISEFINFYCCRQISICSECTFPWASDWCLFLPE